MIAATPALTSVTLRRVSADDERFLRELYASTRERELSIVPWSEEQKAAFLAMQFESQDSYYRTQYPDAQFDVIEIERVPAGRLYVFTTVAELRVIDIALLPQYRNRGIGGGLMRTILRTASDTGRGWSIMRRVVAACRLRPRQAMPAQSQGVSGDLGPRCPGATLNCICDTWAPAALAWQPTPIDRAPPGLHLPRNGCQWPTSGQQTLAGAPAATGQRVARGGCACNLIAAGSRRQGPHGW